MRRLLLPFALVLTVATAAPINAQVWVDGYTRRDGTYVPGHWRSSPNSTVLDNYSTRGNTNPYTGVRGTRDPFGDYIPAAPVTEDRPTRSSRSPTEMRAAADGVSALPWLTEVEGAAMPVGEWTLGWTRRVGVGRRSALIRLSVRDSAREDGGRLLVMSLAHVYRMRRFMETDLDQGRENGCVFGRSVTTDALAPVSVSARMIQRREYARDARLAYEVDYLHGRAETRVVDSHAAGALPLPAFVLPPVVYDSDTWPLLLLALSRTLRDVRRVTIYDHYDGLVEAVVFPIPAAVTTIAKQRRSVRGIGLHYPDVKVGASFFVDDVTGAPVQLVIGRETYNVVDRLHPLTAALQASPCSVA
jgi:hypothetical protein